MPILTVQADFEPKTPDFPHGKGIVRDYGKCSENTDNLCISGLPFPSFNNYIDTVYKGASFKGVTDERRFLTLSNRGQSGEQTVVMSNSIKVKPGDVILARAYIHNNGISGKKETTARDVKFKFEGFSKYGDDLFYSTMSQEITLISSIVSSNTSPRTISDDAILVSQSGKPIRLRFFDTKGALSITPKDSYLNLAQLDQSQMFEEGLNLGDMPGHLMQETFYIWVYFKVVGTSDIKVNKYIGKNQDEADSKKYTLDNIFPIRKNENFYSKIEYHSSEESEDTLKNVVITDDYDQNKVSIMWLPKDCTHNGDIITCRGKDLERGKTHAFYYIGKLKDNAENSLMYEGVSVSSDLDSNKGNNTSYVRIKVSN